MTRSSLLVAFLALGGAAFAQPKAELVNLSTDFLDPTTGASTRVGYLGQPARARVTMTNVGAVGAGAFKVGVVVSRSKFPSLTSGTVAGEVDVTQLAMGATSTVDLPFTLPLIDVAGANFTTGLYYVFTVLDVRGVIPELNNADNALFINEPILLHVPAPDLTVTMVDVPGSGAAGELLPVRRVLKNIGNVDAPPVKYRYFASANRIIDQTNDVPLAIVTGPSASFEGTVTLAAGLEDEQNELVRLPSTLPSGAWFVGCLVETGGLMEELDTGNNALASNVVQVASSSLQVTSLQLLDAVVDRPYSYRLSAMGQQGVAGWTLAPGQGGVPTGISLGTDGLLSGTPSTAGVTSFTVVVTDSGREARAHLTLRVLPTTTQVEITTTSVPPVVNSAGIKYEFSLGVTGGLKPYEWSLVGGELPPNLTLSTDGLLSGKPRTNPPLPEGITQVIVEVKDALGTRATRGLSIRVVASGSIVFKGLGLADGQVGSPYAQDVVAQNADTSPLAKPLTWSLQGELPDGLTFTPSSALSSIEGTPLRAGNYVFTVTVTDARGRSYASQLSIRIYSARLKVSSMDLPATIRPGEQVEFHLTASSLASTRFSLGSGRLPPGLTLASDGTLSGTVASDESAGSYNFVVEAVDSARAVGLGAFRIEVQPEVKSFGCSTGGGLGGLGLALLLVVALRRRTASA